MACAAHCRLRHTGYPPNAAGISPSCSQLLQGRRDVAPHALPGLLSQGRGLELLARDPFVQQHVPPRQLGAQLRGRLGQHLHMGMGKGGKEAGKHSLLQTAAALPYPALP